MEGDVLVMTKRESMNVLKDKFTDVGKSNSIKKIRELYKTVKNLPLTENEKIPLHIERTINMI